MVGGKEDGGEEGGEWQSIRLEIYGIWAFLHLVRTNASKEVDFGVYVKIIIIF